MPVQCCNLLGKTAIITGASRGIGKAIALQLAACGAKISLVARNQKDLAVVQKIIESAGGEAQSIIGDVSNFESFLQIVTQTLEKWQQVDILVNNAGITRDNIIMRMKEDEWDSVININLKGCFNGIKAVTRPMMKKKNGCCLY